MKHKILLTFAILTLAIPVSTANAKGGNSCVKIYTNKAASGWIMNCEGKPKFLICGKVTRCPSIPSGTKFYLGSDQLYRIYP
jgi:hypothetical protein